MYKPTRLPILIVFVISFLQSWAFAGSPQVTYQGRILTAAGEPVTRPVAFKLQIRSPGNEDCVMYEETQSQDLTTTNGIFSLSLNGAGSTRTDGGSYSFSRIFANRGTFTFSSGQCSTGVNYVTAATDNRNLKVFFNDGSGWESLPLQAINPVPQAVEAMQVGGFKPTSLLRVEDSGVLGNVAPLSTDYFNELISLITGVSTQYTKASSNGTVVIPQTSSPTDLAAGQLWFDSGSLKYYNGVTTVTLNSSGSSITATQLPIGTTSATVAAGNDSRIVNAIQNNGYAKSIQVGAAANLPASHTVGRFYVASDSQKIYYDNGTVWITVGDGNALADVTSATVITALGYSPLDVASNLSDLSSSATARTNLGLGSLATLGYIDLNSSYASGTLAITKLPSFDGDVSSSSGTNVLTLNDIGSGVTSGTQYTKVTVDGKGRVTSGANLSASDITSALGYAPAYAASATQWTATGSDIYYALGNVGIGLTAPTAKLHLAAGTSSLAPLKLTSGTLVTSPSSGAIEYDGFNLYYTNGNNVRRTIASVDDIGTQNNTNIISNDSNITLAPTGAVIVSSTTASTSSDTGALVILGGLGIAGNVNTSGTITTSSNIRGASITATSGVSTTVITGAPSLSINPNGGYVGIGTTSPSTTVQISSVASQGVVIGATSYPNWMGTNGLYVEGSFRANTYLVNSGSGINWGASQAKIIGYNPSSGSDTYLSFYTGGIAANGERMRITDSGKIGIGNTTPTALLQLAAGTSSTSSLKLTSGTLLTSAASGSIEYDGFNVYYTDGNNIRRRFSSIDSSGTQSATSIISNTSNITLAPTGSVIVSSTTASTSSNTGALIVSGGLGVAGNIYSSGTIVTSSNIQGASITATAGVSTTVITGVPYLSLNPNGGNVGVGLANPTTARLVVSGTGATSATASLSVVNGGGSSLLHVRNDGYIGMGTNAPTAPLHIYTTAASSLIFERNSAANVNIQYKSTGGSIYAGLSPSNNFAIGTNQNLDSSPIAAFTASGSLGIGTITPAARLTVSGTGATSATASLLVSNSSASPLLYVRNDGFVGIGTSTPSNLLDLYGNSATNRVNLARGATNQQVTYSISPSGTASATNVSWFTGLEGSSNDLRFWAWNGSSANYYMTIANTGNVGIGTTAPTATLTVSGSAATSATASFAVTNGAGSSLMYVRNDGYVGIGTNSPSQSLSVIGSGYISSGFGVGAVADSNYGALRVKGSTTDSTANALHVHNSALTPLIVARNDGNVGIGTSSATVRLDVSGTIVGRTVANATTTIDFSTANLQYTTSDCTTFNLAYLKDGGSYAFAVQGTGSAVCAFNAYSGASGTGALTVHMPPDHGASTAGTHTLYNFIVMGTHVYVSWTKGY